MDLTHQPQKLILLSLSFLPLNTLLADSPPNITTDINWVDSGGEYDADIKLFKASFGGVTDIEAAFNHGRREEEKQLSLTPGQLGDLDLPSQTIWDSMSDNARALYIVNAERVARKDMKPGVIGLPFAGVESHIDAVSHRYGDTLHDYDQTGHYHDGTPTYRIERDPVIGTQHSGKITYPVDISQTDPTSEAPYTTWQPVHSDGSNHYFADSFEGTGSCHEFITRSENLAYYASTAPILLPLERSLYSFIYDDASSHWGHREALFLQDNGLSYSDRKPGETGYNNDNGSSETEGFMGVYVRSSNKTDNPNNVYQPFQNFGDFSYGTVVVMNFFDPVADGTPGCSYRVTTATESLPNAVIAASLRATADTATTTSNTAVTIDILKNDTATDQLVSLTIVTAPKHGSAQVKSNRITYLPASSYTGSDSLVYQLTDKSGGTSSATVSLRVTQASTTTNSLPPATSSNPAKPDNSRSGNVAASTPQTSTASSGTGNTGSSGGGALGWLLTVLLLPAGRLLRRRRF